jgi:hypothetical protein
MRRNVEISDISTSDSEEISVISISDSEESYYDDKGNDTQGSSLVLGKERDIQEIQQNLVLPKIVRREDVP